MKRKLAGLLVSGLLVGAALPATAAQKSYYCFGHRATIVGTPGSDSLHGTDGQDVIAARGGFDRVSGGDGNDLICGGGGDDSDENYLNSGGLAGLSGGRGDDWISGGRGWDLNGESGADVVYGGWGKDHLLDYRHDHEYADPEPLPGSDDLLFGGPGNDWLTATAGEDFLSGGSGIDSLVNSAWDWDDYSYEETLDHGSDTILVVPATTASKRSTVLRATTPSTQARALMPASATRETRSGLVRGSTHLPTDYSSRPHHTPPRPAH